MKQTHVRGPVRSEEPGQHSPPQPNLVCVLPRKEAPHDLDGRLSLLSTGTLHAPHGRIWSGHEGTSISDHRRTRQSARPPPRDTQTFGGGEVGLLAEVLGDAAGKAVVSQLLLRRVVREV